MLKHFRIKYNDTKSRIVYIFLHLTAYNVAVISIRATRGTNE